MVRTRSSGRLLHPSIGADREPVEATRRTEQVRTAQKDGNSIFRFSLEDRASSGCPENDQERLRPAHAYVKQLLPL